MKGNEVKGGKHACHCHGKLEWTHQNKLGQESQGVS